MARDSFGLRWNFHLLAESDFVVVAPNYSGSVGFGEAFSRSVQGTPLKASADDINLVIAEVARRYEFVDGTRVGIAGASYGAHIVNWLEATTNKYKCFVAHAGLANLESQWATSDKSFEREVTTLQQVAAHSGVVSLVEVLTDVEYFSETDQSSKR